MAKLGSTETCALNVHDMHTQWIFIYVYFDYIYNFDLKWSVHVFLFWVSAYDDFTQNFFRARLHEGK